MNLVTCIDEMIVLHARIANQLLAEFPDAHGVNFVLDIPEPMAYALADVPADYADGYTDEALEARSVELLADIKERASEVMASVASLGITPRDFVLKARRSKLKGGFENAAHVTGAIMGHLGAGFVRKTALSNVDRVLLYQPAEFHLVALVEDASFVSAIKEASGKSFKAALDHLLANKQLLNIKSPSDSRLADWIDSFPHDAGQCEFQYTAPIGRIICSQTDQNPRIYVPKGKDTLGVDTAAEYDLTKGFAFNATSEPSVTASTFGV